MAIDKNTLGWIETRKSGIVFLILDSSVWSRPALISGIPANLAVAITVATLVEIITPEDEGEFVRRKECASRALNRASILLPNGIQYKRHLFGRVSLSELLKDTQDFLLLLELFDKCPTYAAWMKKFSELLSERNAGYLSFADEMAKAVPGVHKATLEIAKEAGIELAVEIEAGSKENVRADRAIVRRSLLNVLSSANWQPHLLPEIRPEFRDSVFYYLRLYIWLIATNLPNLSDSSGLDPTGNDIGDMETALFVGNSFRSLGSMFGVGLIYESKWDRLSRELDQGARLFPMGTPKWWNEISRGDALFDAGHRLITKESNLEVGNAVWI